MSRSISPRTWAILFFLCSMLSFSVLASQTFSKIKEMKHPQSESEDRRQLDSYCAVIAGMSSMTLIHGFWQAEYLEAFVGIMGLAISLGALYWPEHEAQAARADRLTSEQLTKALIIMRSKQKRLSGNF